MTTPTWPLPMWTQSPCCAISLPVISKPTNFFWGLFFLLINSSFPIKLASLDLSGTVNPIPASRPARINPASILNLSNASKPIGVISNSLPASQTASHTLTASLGWQYNS